MHHFFLEPSCIQGKLIYFPYAVSKQIRRVLRLKEDGLVMVLDDAGKQYLSRLEFGPDMKVIGHVESVEPARGEPEVECWIYLSLSQREKMEWVLQKGTELGMTGMVPVISQRSLVQDARVTEKKRERWERILKEAAEQCHRGRIPELGKTLPFNQALIDANERADVVLIASVVEGVQSFRSVLQAGCGKRYAVFIGPEGGFFSEEVEAASAMGCIPVSMGDRVLRMETAAITAVALIQYELGK
ncbi:MAG: 16S rRNA (uracil(1498)-N(3))-methyltransferase [Anaerolineaceae bacterium]|nr:16S rRNA (uracil(1498)-N(3))-methyltransferase [Anaerolineaceae bacterium]